LDRRGLGFDFNWSVINKEQAVNYNEEELIMWLGLQIPFEKHYLRMKSACSGLSQTWGELACLLHLQVNKKEHGEI
jgi:hypothetical protein